MRIYPHADVPEASRSRTADRPLAPRAVSLVLLAAVLGALLLSSLGVLSIGGTHGAPSTRPSSAVPASPVSFATASSHPAVVSASSNATHANGSWVRLAAVSHPSPGARASASLVYDTADATLVLFGGLNPKTGPLGDTWVYSAGTWTNLTPSLSTSPSPRYGAAAVYDPYDGFVLLFGGITAQGTAGDAWTFTHGAWSLLSNSNSSSPAARSYSGLANDRGSGSVVLFGGAGSQGAPLGDTWAYVAGGWKNITSAAGISPPARSDATLSLDPTTSSIILFGGTGLCGQPCGDTWSLASGKWTNLTATEPVSPSARSDATSMYDPVTGALLLFGGRSSALLNDTWRHGATGWTNLTFSLTSAPAPSYGSAAAFDPADGYAVVVGGHTPNGLRGAVWAFIEAFTTRLLVSAPVIAPDAAVIFTSQLAGGVGPYQAMIDPGDGSTPAYATVLTHTYTSEGNYTASLSTTDSRGVGAWVLVNISVVSYPLRVTLIAHPQVAAPRQAVTLTAVVTGGSAPYRFTWSGLPTPCLTSNIASLQCAAQSVGTYSVTVTVTDSANRHASGSSNFTVAPLSASTSGPFAPTVGSSLISRVGWNIVPAIVAAMGMSALAAFLMYREAKAPAPARETLPDRPMCYIPPEWSETPDDFR